MDFFQKKRIFQEKNPIFVWQFRKKQYLCIALDETWAVSAVGSEHLPYKQRVGGSNPSLPTRAVRTTVRSHNSAGRLLFYMPPVPHIPSTLRLGNFKREIFLKIFWKNVWQFKKLLYLCTAFDNNTGS